jgi:hypothetical protein
VIGHGFRPREFGALYERIRPVSALSYVDPLLEAVRRSALPARGVLELGRRLAATGRHVEPVKLGIALLGTVRGNRDRDLLLTLGRHDEFTLFCAVAVSNSDPDREAVLWSLARGATGWGRIQAVERLRDTERADIQDWLVREGFRNSVMAEYLAYIAATTGRLLDRLTAASPDDQLLEAAGEIISALVPGGGPAEGIDDYADAPGLLSVFTALMSARARQLTDFVVVDDIAEFLRSDDGWPDRYHHGWTPDQRARLLAMGPEFAAHNALDFILQDLGRFPGHGWPLIETGLRCPVTRVRNMAAKALSGWPAAAWPPHARQALADAAAIEPDDRAREHMNEVLAGTAD